MNTQITATTNRVRQRQNRFASDVNGIRAILHITAILDDISDRVFNCITHYILHEHLN